MRFRGRESDAESTPPGLVVLDRDGAVVGLDRRPAERQPQPPARAGAGSVVVEARIRLEDAISHAGWDPGSLVADGDLHGLGARACLDAQGAVRGAVAEG